MEAVTSADTRVQPMIVGVTEPLGQHAYPSEVKFEIRQNIKGDYPRAAEFVNYSHVRIVSIQHEYGIFGGEDGGYILDFVRALRVPVIVTLHTVLKQPSANQARIVQKLAVQCAQLIVMSQVAKDLLANSYGVRGEKVRIIPHGIPVMQPVAQEALKAKFGVAGRRLLLTFGLLSPNKGIETVIRALPEVIRKFPDLMYFVVGATHPVIKRREGEAYRTMLEREAEKLGVREHLMFRGQFVSDEELRQYLQAADAFVSPYLNEAQVTSGALSYAMGAGAAVLSTPYWHAQELLADGRGGLFPFKDSAALSRMLIEWFSSPSELLRVRTAATNFARAMAWPRIGEAYFEVIQGALRISHDRPSSPPLSEVAPASSLPELSLDHLIRMTDDTGIIQHATYSVPARQSGYCVDDNARALIVAVQADRINGSAETKALVTRYLSYLYGSQNVDGTFSNFMTYERVLDGATSSDDCLGRAIWALGISFELADAEGCRMLARDMLNRALPHAEALGPRGSAQALLGLVSVLNADPNAADVRRVLDVLAAKLMDCYRQNAAADWRWFEPSLTYDNALLPLALFAAYGVTGDRASLRDARESLEFLEEVCFEGEQLQLVGNSGWHSRGGEKASVDEQAIDAAAFVLAFCCAYTVTNDRHYLRRMREAFAWFLGANRLGMPLYDFATGGCRDGMGDSYVNQNQGAESTICFLIALLKMLELDGEGLGHADTQTISESAR
ncbi:MAG TPA: glycosyltransferase family 4 protein [Polyangiales bacterium]|nr:glycosyltransferase family 4 protein [Polyangiales bacterium]